MPATPRRARGTEAWRLALELLTALCWIGALEAACDFLVATWESADTAEWFARVATSLVAAGACLTGVLVVAGRFGGRRRGRECN